MEFMIRSQDGPVLTVREMAILSGLTVPNLERLRKRGCETGSLEGNAKEFPPAADAGFLV